MIEFLKACWDFLRHVTETAPTAFWPLIVGLLFSALLTQKFKFALPLSWPTRTRASITQAVAMLSGFGATYALWPTLAGAFSGAIVGMASPTCYYIFVRVLGTKYPVLRDILSADVREGETK
jgi:hypothetical protein